MYRHFKSDAGRDVQICIALGVLEKTLASSSGESHNWNAKAGFFPSAEDVEFASYGGPNVSNALYKRTSDKTFF